MTTNIKFFWNGIKVNGSKSLIKVFYSLDNNKDHAPSVSISSQGYGDQLPGDLFTVYNDTDYYTDYFDTDRATLTPEHPLYKYARAAAEKAEIRSLTRSIEQLAQNIATRPAFYCRDDFYKNELQAKREKLAELQTHKDPGQPTAADLAAVESMNTAAETARIAAEKEAEQQRREKVLNEQNEGRRYIGETAARYPLQDGAPAVTISWSEHPAFYSFHDGIRLSVAAAEIVLKHYDVEIRAAGEGCYKTDFKVEYTSADGEPSTYEGYYNLGSNDGGLIAHIRDFGRNYQERGHFGNGQPTEEDKQEGAEIVALADLLERYTAAGRIVSVTLAPWVTETLEARKKAEQQEFHDMLEAVEMLTDEQLEAAVLQVPRDDPDAQDVARFFLQKLAQRDKGKALEALRKWKRGA